MSDAQTSQQNVDGKGGAGPELLIAVAAGVAVEVIKVLVDALNPKSRSVILEISNNTSLTLIKQTDEHSHGQFKEQPPPQIAPNSAVAFSSESSSVFTGTEGSVTYVGDGLTVNFAWDNPYIGDNSTDASKDGMNKSRYVVFHETGKGNTDAHMKYYLFIHPDYSVKASLKNKGNPSQGLRSYRPGASAISVRDLVDY